MKATAYNATLTDDDGYEQFLAGLRQRFALVTADTPHLFRTDTEGLFFTFLGALPSDRRQHYTCHACRRFVEQFGGLVVIKPDGSQVPAMWDADDAPPMFSPAVEQLFRAVYRARVTGVHRVKESVWGQPVTEPWHHMSVVAPFRLLCAPTPLQTPGQIAAEKTQDFEMLQRGLAAFSIDAIRQAKALLGTDALYRSEKCLGVATWLLDLQERLAATKNERAKENMVWLAVAGAPPGWCHVRSTMIGTLLEDIASGMAFDAVSRRFAEKMHPLQYQRPTAAPTDGQIAAAEKAIETLGATGALQRRFAKIEDLQLLWRPIERGALPAEGVFGHLKNNRPGPTSLDAPAAINTWAKFAREVLPTAERIEYMVASRPENYLAFVTAANPDAPNILQWDNTVSWYVYHGGSIPVTWALQRGEWCDVTGITLKPSMWGEKPLTHQGESVTLILRGARDMRYKRGAGLFPELLRSEYHAIRHVLEAHVRVSPIAGRDEATACGLCLQKGSPWNCLVRVTVGPVRMLYRLDRWD